KGGFEGGNAQGQRPGGGGTVALGENVRGTDQTRPRSETRENPLDERQPQRLGPEAQEKADSEEGGKRGGRERGKKGRKRREEEEGEEGEKRKEGERKGGGGGKKKGEKKRKREVLNKK
ncbi:hypothetical protein, partial [Escherichia coli]|uniref:hypothetical protein n=1 Tax=Escherichia coli TaxID=562 RepID=UPI002B24CA21